MDSGTEVYGTLVSEIQTDVEVTGKVIKPKTEVSPYVSRDVPVKYCNYVDLKKIVGASVVWNQLVDSNTTSVTIASGHRYIAKINGTLTFGTSNGSAIAVDGSRNDYFTDITSAFNTTIADYVYTLEQATSGSGIAWLQSYGFFTEDYYAYTQNKLESGCVSAKKVTGFNQWDEAIEVGSIDTNGNNSSGADRLRSTNYIKVISGKTYYFRSQRSVNSYFYLRLYDSNKTYITNASVNINNTYTIPSNVAYIRFTFVANTVGTYYNDICINISNTAKNGTYEPYTETTYPISPITLRGLFKLSTDKLTVDGDEYNADGSVERNYEQRAYQSGDESLANAITDGTNTIVKLATPTTELTLPFTETQRSGDTEQFDDYGVISGTRDVAIPVGNETDYLQNYAGQITGTLKYIENGLAPSGYLSGSGNFIALQLEADDWDIYTSVKVGLDPSQESGLVEILQDEDKIVVGKISSNEQVFIVESTDGTLTKTDVYDLSELVLETE